MTTRKYLSTSQETTLTSAMNSAQTTMVVNSAAGLLGSITPAAGETFTVVIDPDTSLEEIVDVITPSSPGSNTLTITRPIDGTSAIAHSAGAKVRHMAIGRDFREANIHQESNLTAHAATTSAQLASVISDETGTGSLVFNTNPTIVTPTIASFANATHNHTNAAGGGTLTSAAVSDFTEAAQDAVGAMFSGNTESGISVTYDDATNKVNFDVNDPVISIDGDVAGSATMTDLGNVTINTAISPGVIVNADISGIAAIAASKIAGTAVTQADTGTVTSTMIADGTIVNADVSATAAIAKTKLDLNGTITSADIVDGTIVNADINASAAIALSKLATDPLARANHTGTQTASTISDFDTQVRTSRLDQMAAPTASVSLNSQKITNLATPTASGDAVSLGYLNGQKGVASGIASLDGSGLIPTSQLPALAISETSVVASQAAMLALTAQTGDIAVRTDLNKSFILTASPASTLGNWQELLTPTDAVLSVDGNTGAISLSGTYLNRTTGQLLGNLDANNFKVTGLGAPTSANDAATKTYVDAVAGSATAAAASAAAAATTYDNFDDRYLGAKSTPPTLDNDGNAILEGALYWNSVDNAMYAWDTGTSSWGSISSTAAIYRYKFVATGGETSVSGTDANGLTLSYLAGKEQVYLNGILLVRGSDYTASTGTSITSLAALAASDILEVITFTAFDLATAIPNTTFDAKGDLLVASAADTVGKLSVGTNGYFLKANSGAALGVEWAAVDALPSQTGNNGKYLTTDGSTASWGAITTDPNPSIFMLMGA
jgi:hypothetical protein